MPRSVWKGFYCDVSLTKAVRTMQMAGGVPTQGAAMRVMSRQSAILPEFLGYRFEVHNGKKFYPIEVKSTMIGKKFGEFAPTRQYPKFPDAPTPTTGPPPKK